jgi:hypothetical protein
VCVHDACWPKYMQTCAFDHFMRTARYTIGISQENVAECTTQALRYHALIIAVRCTRGECNPMHPRTEQHKTFQQVTSIPIEQSSALTLILESRSHMYHATTRPSSAVTHTAAASCQNTALQSALASSVPPTTQAPRTCTQYGTHAPHVSTLVPQTFFTHIL